MRLHALYVVDKVFEVFVQFRIFGHELLHGFAIDAQNFRLNKCRGSSKLISHLRNFLPHGHRLGSPRILIGKLGSIRGKQRKTFRHFLVKIQAGQ